MQVEIKIDQSCKEPKIIVLTDQITDEVNTFSLFYGAAFGGTSVIWEIENWSLLRMTVTHLAICSIVTFPIAYLMQWMSHDIAGILLYFGIFLAVYLLIWGFQYHAIRKKIDQINHKVQERSQTKNRS